MATRCSGSEVIKIQKEIEKKKNLKNLIKIKKIENGSISQNNFDFLFLQEIKEKKCYVCVCIGGLAKCVLGTNTEYSK